MIVGVLTARSSALGSLDIAVTPPDAAVQVSGPGGYARNQVGGSLIESLAAGLYTVTASSGGYSVGENANVQAGSVARVVLSPVQRRFGYYINETRYPGEATTFVVYDDGGAEVPGSRETLTTTPGYTQYGRNNFTLTLGGSYTLEVSSPRLGTRRTRPFTAQQAQTNQNAVAVTIYQNSISGE